jgi:hypothetical protein
MSKKLYMVNYYKTIYKVRTEGYYKVQPPGPVPGRERSLLREKEERWVI